MDKKNLKIGVLIPDINSPYYSEVVNGISEYLKKMGHKFVLCSCGSDPLIERSSFDFFKHNQCDGLIVISCSLKREDIQTLKEQGLRIVLADNKIDAHFSAVINDNYAGARALFSHMLKMGCRKIGFLGGHPESYVIKERLRAYRDVLRENGIKSSSKLLVFGGSNQDFGYQNTQKLLDLKVDSIFGINDLVASGVMKYCDEHNIRIPEELKLTGFDDLDLSSMLKVPLTTVYQSKELLGKKACELLISEIQSPFVTMSIVLDTTLKIRTSC